MKELELDRWVSDVFHGGELRRRELRLSDEDARLLAGRYPASVKPLGEQWYLVSFEGELCRGA